MARREPTYEELKDEYARLFAECKVLPHWVPEADRVAQCIIAARAELEKVEAATGVPWQIVGCIQMMEAGTYRDKQGVWHLDLRRHMHNGDLLTARTHQVPPGRPLAPPANGRTYTFFESALDAIKFEGLDKIKTWDVPRLLHKGEDFNGWGYRWFHPTVLTPYLWSGTNLYKVGKYASDGHYVPTLVSGQVGLVPVLKRLQELGVWMRDDQPLAVVSDEDVSESADEAMPRWPVAEPVRDTATTASDVTAEGSRTMSVFDMLSMKFKVLFGGFSGYEAMKWFSDGKGAIGDGLVLIERHAPLIIGMVIASTIVLVIYGKYFLTEAVRDGRYDPRKPANAPVA